VRRLARALALLLLLAAVGALTVREIYAPRLTLPIRDLLTGRRSGPVSAHLTDELEVRLHATTRPHVGKIAALQKGLVLLHRGRPLVEEGYGFGLPIVETEAGAHIARNADVSRRHEGGVTSLIKTYRIDVLDTPTRPFSRKYVDVPPLGQVVFTYTVRPPDRIDVTADFRGLETDWRRAYVMNEQGARAFAVYVEPDGDTVLADEMGIWEETTAPFGCWESPDRDLRFCVEATIHQPGFVGRERYLQFNWLGFYSLSWSGIDLAVDPPRETFSYTIRVETGAVGE